MSANPTLAAGVTASAEDFGKWLTRSGSALFPYFTDHGPHHVQDVLVTAESLITDASWDIITPEDTAVLALSVLIHDCGMWISEDGFVDLIRGPYGREGVHLPDIDRIAWPDLWDEFLYSASRWDDREVSRVFGSGDDTTVPLIRTSPEDVGEWTTYDRLLAGEFVREHHPRLAHEVAVAGMPGPGMDRLYLHDSLSEDIRNIAGLVARSHGSSLRASFEYLTQIADLRDHGGLHAIFIMVLLRLADYLQVQAARAPEQVLKVKGIRNPFSAGEWEAHRVVKHINVYNDDPELIKLVAEPLNVRTFLRLRRWVEDFQSELDASWAVLGEVYGRFSPLNQLGVAIRRVRSNLEADGSSERRWPFLPRQVQFQVARPELLQLMIRPLYGDRPEIGVRELIQNALDAVREREALGVPDNDVHPDLEDADVVVDVIRPTSDAAGRVSVTDRGVGMTPTVLIDYFLTAGASYRASEEWKRQFQHQIDSLKPKSAVVRSGRFGVGALASFLLGTELSVETRHVEAPSGLRLTTSLDDEAIEVLWDDSLPVGTRISVPISKATWEQLSKRTWRREGSRDSWDWYCWREPSVIRYVDGVRLRQSLNVPQRGESQGAWTRLPEAAGFGDVYWTYEPKFPSLIVNGLLVPDDSRAGRPLADEGHVVVPMPRLNVTDPDGAFPLSLQRDRMTGEVPFRTNLVRSVVQGAVAAWKAKAPPGLASRALFTFPGVTAASNYYYRKRLGPWLVLDDGVTLLTEAALAAANLRRLVLVVDRINKRGGDAVPEWPLPPDDGRGVILARISRQRAESFDDLKWCLFPERFHLIDSAWSWEVTGTQVIVPQHFASDLPGRKKPRYMDTHVQAETHGQWTRLTVGKPRELLPPAWLFQEPAGDNWSRWFVAWDVEPQESTEVGEAGGQVSEIDAAWLDAVGGWLLNV